MTQRYASYGFIGIVVALGLLPVLSMVAHTFYDAHGVTLSHYKVLFTQPSLVGSFSHSLGLGVFVASLTTLVGTSLGILFSKTTLRYRTVWVLLLLIPLLIPPYILAYGWYTLVGRESMLGHLLFGFWGSAWVLFCVYLPIPVLLTILFLRQINPKLEEAGLLVCSWYGVLWHITLPLVKPALYFSFLLVFILAVSELSVANFLHFDIFPMQSFIQFSAFYDFTTATVYAMPLLVIVLVLLAIVAILLKQRPLALKSYHYPLIFPLKGIQLPVQVSIVLLLVLVIGFPLWGLLVQSSLPDFMQALKQALSPLTHSLLYATVGALLLVIFGFFSATILVSKNSKGWQVLNFTLLFLFILSSTVLGIALILFWNTPYTNFIYTTPLIILLGYLSKTLFLSTKIIQIKLSQIPSSLLEMAALTGASYRQIVSFIVLPLAKEALFVSGVIGFIFILRESTITMLVAPAGTSTLPLYILTQMANGKPSTIASLCLLMILIVLIPLAALVYYFKRKKVHHDSM